MAMFSIILGLVVQSSFGYRSRPASLVDHESRESLPQRPDPDFYVFYDLYDLVEVMASSSAISQASSTAISQGSSMVETAASSESGKLASKGGFEISAESLKSAAKAYNLSADGLNVSTQAFSHSEIVFCEAKQFNSEDRNFLKSKIGTMIPESFNTDASRRNYVCTSMFFGFSECTQPACSIGASWQRLGAANTNYGKRYRIPLGVASLKVNGGGSPAPALIEIIKTKKDQWKGGDYSFVEHNCNTFARYLVRCILEMRMPSGVTLGANYAVSSATWGKWITSIGATVVGGLLGGPLALVAGPLVFMALPGKFCDK